LTGSSWQAGIIVDLLRRLGDLDTAVDLEQSFKIAPAFIAVDRLLLGVSRTTGVIDSGILRICDEIGMPGDFRDAFASHLLDANHVYFGAESSDAGLTLKVYLEYRDQIEARLARIGDIPGPAKLFTGFKWDAAAPARRMQTDYRWFPSLPTSDILAAVRGGYPLNTVAGLGDVAVAIIERTLERGASADVQYLEVAEPGNARRSFDLNVYKTGYRLADVRHLLLEGGRRCNLPSDWFNRFLDRIEEHHLGHIAGGVDRSGREFLTVYHGARKLQPGQLRDARVGGQARAGQSL
jgi:hypothetical protein